MIELPLGHESEFFIRWIRKEESVVRFATGSPLPEFGEMRSANVHDRAEDF